MGKTTSSEPLTRHVVCGEDELGPGEMKTILHGRVPVVVIRAESGEYFAVRGLCPHQGALLGKGVLWPLTSSDGPGTYNLSRGAEILRCPWHAFEYDVTTGVCLTDPRLRVRTYPVTVEDGEVVVDLRGTAAVKGREERK